MNSYLLHRPNRTHHAITATLELQFHISDLIGKIIKNVKFLSVSQNIDLTSKLDPTRQHESRGMLGFQNRALDIKLLKFHVNQDNQGYLEKRNFQQKLVY